MKKEQASKKMALLDNQVRMLMQSFDAVQIFAMKYDPKTNDTHTFAVGEGPFPARVGQVHEWMMQNMARQFKSVMNEKEAQGPGEIE